MFKDGDETDPCNYRPISLLSIFNRIFEKIMSNRLKVFLNKHDIFYKSQYTEHAILDIVSKIQANMDLGMFSCGIFIDLQKAFDTVDHSILLHKLNHYGIRGVVNDWFSSYLSGRVQTTQIESYISQKEKPCVGSHRATQHEIMNLRMFMLCIKIGKYETFSIRSNSAMHNGP